jgi:hypothetical protein
LASGRWDESAESNGREYPRRYIFSILLFDEESVALQQPVVRQLCESVFFCRPEEEMESLSTDSMDVSCDSSTIEISRSSFYHEPLVLAAYREVLKESKRFTGAAMLKGMFFIYPISVFSYSTLIW